MKIRPPGFLICLLLAMAACGDDAPSGPDAAPTPASACDHLCDHMEACDIGLICDRPSCEASVTTCSPAELQALDDCGEVECSTDELAPLKCRNAQPCYQ